jgi:hypothetical protein
VDRAAAFPVRTAITPTTLQQLPLPGSAVSKPAVRILARTLILQYHTVLFRHAISMFLCSRSITSVLRLAINITIN